MARADVSVVIVLLATLATLLVAASLKSYCLESWEPGHQPKTCYNDIQTLWYSRSMDEHVLPYQGDVHTEHRDGELVKVELGAGEIEYPVLTGVFAWATALFADGAAGYLALTALALIPFALLTALALQRLSGGRALLFALSPQLAAYAFLNWDLLPVAATALALWAWRRDRQVLAAVLLSLGACAKLWPGFLLLPLVIYLLVAGRRRAAALVVGSSVATAVAVNLGFMIANFQGWVAPYLMQSVRLNDLTTNSVWYWLLDPTSFAAANRWSALAVLAGWTVIIVVGWRRRSATDGYPWIQVSAAMVSSYIVLGRVDSPQYGLWLVPFLVVLAVPPRWIIIFAVTDIWLWLQWSWLWSTPDWVMVSAMVFRGLALVGLTVVFLRSPVAMIQTSTAPVTSGAANSRKSSMMSVRVEGGPAARPGT